MPNYAFSKLKLIGPLLILKDLQTHSLDFSHYVPIPDGYAASDVWGTHYSPLDIEMKLNEEDCILIARFMTAWSPHTRFLECLLLYPILWIQLK